MPTLLIAVALLTGVSSGPAQISTNPSETSTRSVIAPMPESARVYAASGDEIVARAHAAYLARMERIENYTIVQSIMGMESTAYFEKEVVNGQVRFTTRTVIAAGQRIEHEAEVEEDLYAALAAHAGRTKLKGTETVDGHRTYALVVDDFSGLPGLGTTEVGDVEFTRATLYLDASSYVLRRMEMEGTVRGDTQARPVTVTGRMEDYREVRGMLHPFRTVLTMHGIDATMSEADIEEARRGLEELRAQMETMPAAQRRMMESMLRPQIEQFESMVGGEGVNVVIEVKELRVNEGPPA